MVLSTCSRTIFTANMMGIAWIVLEISEQLLCSWLRHVWPWVKVNIINTRCIIMSETVTVPCLTMMTSTVFEESLARDSQTDRQTDRQVNARACIMWVCIHLCDCVSTCVSDYMCMLNVVNACGSVSVCFCLSTCLSVCPCGCVCVLISSPRRFCFVKGKGLSSGNLHNYSSALSKSKVFTFEPFCVIWCYPWICSEAVREYYSLQNSVDLKWACIAWIPNRSGCFFLPLCLQSLKLI